MQRISARLEGLGQEWNSGETLIDVHVTLGQNENSSNCSVMLSDPLGTIAQALINHSLATGGITKLPSAKTASAPNTPPAPGIASTSGSVVPVHRGNGYTPEFLAFFDLIAYRETPEPLTIHGYYANNQIALGFFTEQEARQGFPVSAGTTQNVGRYQFNKGDYVEFQTAFPYIRDYLPDSQDQLAMFKMMRINRGGKELAAGDFKGAVAKACKEWESMPGGGRPLYTYETAVSYYNQRLAVHRGSATSVSTDPKVVPETPKPAETSNTQDEVKGNKITIDWLDYSFEFYHQGTEWSESGITKVSGQGIRWILNRRKRNKTLQNLSLKDLATQIAQAHKVKLDWQSEINPTYEHIDQSGISDYQLLKRECEFAGLYVSETKDALTIKSRDKISDTQYLVARGLNLVSYHVDDKALDPNSTDKSALLLEEPKAEIEPISGTMKTKIPDVDKVASKDTTGEQKKQISGKTSPGQDAQLATERSRMKRVKGLPSMFRVILGADTLALKPLDAVRTTGFPGVLSRIWLVDKVTHKALENTTVLDVYSPVEVLDDSPAPAPGITPAAAGTLPPPTPGQWVYPATGPVTSPFGPRNISYGSKFHKGVDIGASFGSPIVAAADGVAFAQGGQYNIIVVKHSNQYTTRYLHCNTIIVGNGTRVTKGQQIGTVGNTGAPGGTHLHFEIFEPGGTFEKADQINPVKVFPKLGSTGNQINGGTAP